ncbi:MAG: alanine racemase [Akkermansiaceae bacterium]|nr:alanine racemase [Akkermansiaceae bacterium]
MTESPPRAWAEIDRSALHHNLQLARRHSGEEVMAVIKGGAYGHGLVEIAKELDKQNLPFLGVANTGEARCLSKEGIKTRPYILGATLQSEREEIAACGWTPCLCSFEEMEHFNLLGKDSPIEAHLALDTGMGRGGFLPHQLGEALEKLSKASGIKLTGVGSHLPVADEDPVFTRKQFELFDSMVESIPGRNEKFHIHLSNSAGLLDYQSRTTNLARPGLLLYGISPLPKYQKALKPVMALKSRISMINHLPKGHGVSYGRTILKRDTKAAILGLGYGDGYPRSLSGKEVSVLINNSPCPLLGRVTMDQIIVDVTELEICCPGDEAELFGPNLLVSDLSKKAETIPWEILTQITPRVTRFYR